MYDSPDKQLYLLTLKDVEEQDNIPTVFLEGGQDRHPGSDEVDDLIQREVDAAAVQKAIGGVIAAGGFPSYSGMYGKEGSATHFQRNVLIIVFLHHRTIYPLP